MENLTHCLTRYLKGIYFLYMIYIEKRETRVIGSTVAKVEQEALFEVASKNLTSISMVVATIISDWYKKDFKKWKKKIK